MEKPGKMEDLSGTPGRREKMNRFIFMLSAAVLLALLSAPFAGLQGAPAQAQPPHESVAKGNNAFSVQLYRQLGAKEGNLFFSPYSISSALGMTYAGARGNTAKEMEEVLNFRSEQAQLHGAFKSLNKELTETAGKAGQKLKIANALVLTGGNVSNDFIDILKDSYGAEMFGGGLEVINSWVKKRTEGKIEKILEKLSPDSVCVILNAIYFKGTWDVQFKKEQTRNAPFNVSKGKQVPVSLMHQKGDLKVMEENGFQAVSIPYKGKSMSMVILLPKAVDGLPALEEKLTDRGLNEWLAILDGKRPQKVYLYLPKFKLETGYDLKSPFDRMGMKDAFREGVADFTGMGWKKGLLWIGQIKHKAFVEVNEEGTEAAAATAVEMVTKTAARPDHVIFRADHPFFFIIRDNRTGTILFMGRLTEPTGK